MFGIVVFLAVMTLSVTFLVFLWLNAFNITVRIIGTSISAASLLVAGLFLAMMITQLGRFKGKVQKQETQKVEETEGRFKALIQNSLDLITIVDAKGEITYQSPSSERVLGFPPEDIVGQSIFELLHGEDRPLMQNVLDQKAQTFFFAYRMQHYDGSWRYFECSGTNLTENPLIQGIVINARDVSDRKKEEEARRQKELAAIRFNMEKEKAEEERNVIAKQKEQIEEAYQIIEHKNEEIMDSINYAFRIQTAILPSDEEIQKSLPNSFVFFRPKDVVSGDFYWFTETPEYVLITAADCTGHGVPGAFMTMIGNTLLNQIVKQEGIVMPDLILNELHKGVRRALKQDQGSESKDGMDISFITLEKNSKKLHWAGANNPLVFVRNGEIDQIKADKNAIGGRQDEDERLFTRHSIDILEGDKFFIFSDGYQDQFGGPRGRKFMVKKFKKLLAEISTESPQKQKETLNQQIEDWMGKNHEQVDDMVIIGLQY
ncbi:MAG: PAS domain S-box protein [Bacteroidota bacterium]